MKYSNHSSESYFNFLKNGQKTIEGRVRKGVYANIQPGDTIVVYNKDETEKVETKVIRVTRYESIGEMLTCEELNKMLPDAQTIDQGVSIYRQFYSLEQEKEFWIVEIEIENLILFFRRIPKWRIGTRIGEACAYWCAQET